RGRSPRRMGGAHAGLRGRATPPRPTDRGPGGGGQSRHHGGRPSGPAGARRRPRQPSHRLGSAMSQLDPVTYAILRHRLWAINVEAALALQGVSGSPLATEAFDMNTSIMTAAGEVTFVGPYLLTGSMSQGMIARHILAEYAD